MISNSKRYKNRLELIQTAVRKSLKDDYVTLQARVLFGKGVYRGDHSGLMLSYTYKLDTYKRFMMFENPSDGVVYFGLDTTNTAFKYDSSQLESEVFYALVQWASAYDFTVDGFFEGSPYDLYQIKDNRKLLKELPEYKNLLSMVMDVNNSGKAEVILKPDQFPRLKRRDFLPVAWVDFEKDEMAMTTNNYVDSYRKGIERVPVSTADLVSTYPRDIRACPRLLQIYLKP